MRTGTTTFLTGALVALAAAPASTVAQRVLKTWETSAGRIAVQRVWYGDGATYVGPTVPPGIRTAFNFTIDEARRDLLFINIDDENSSVSTDLPNPSFLVANAGPGAKDSFTLAASAVGLTHDNIYLFGAMEGFWFPHTRDGIAKGGAYLVPTGVEGTSQVRWIVDAADAAELKARPVTLSTR